MAASVTRAVASSRRLLVALLIGTSLVTACSSAPPPPAPTPRPTPLVTPDPHLADPATVQEVFSGLGQAGLRITPNTASAGSSDGPVVTRIFATYLGWPLEVTEFRTSDALAKAASWAPGAAPGSGQEPIAIAGGNILVTWGPAISGANPPLPDARQAEGLVDLVDALDALLSPIRARMNVEIVPPVAAAGDTSAP